MTSQEQLNNIINGYKLSVAEKNLRISELEKIVKAFAHIGINFDFGFISSLGLKLVPHFSH